MARFEECVQPELPQHRMRAAPKPETAIRPRHLTLEDGHSNTSTVQGGGEGQAGRASTDDKRSCHPRGLPPTVAPGLDVWGHVLQKVF